MKKMNSIAIMAAGLFAILMVSCENQAIEFPDYDYSTVYFAYQYPVRTIVLGEDLFDNSLDLEHKCKIYATMGGVYENTERIDIDIEVDNTLCDRLLFSDSSAVMAMPSTYYTLEANQISLDGSLLGGIEVQLSDAFFTDNLSIQNSYVIPLKMTNVVNADSILSGSPKFDGAVRGNDIDWDVLPKDYVLYCVKFINPWHGNYLRRGEDIIDGTTLDTIINRHEAFVEYDDVATLTTTSINTVEFQVSLQDDTLANVTCALLLTFNGSDQCTVSSSTSGYSASGSGSFVSKGEKDSWGDQDRSAIYLDYNIDLGGKTYETKDTLVVRDRGVSIETFIPVYDEI